MSSAPEASDSEPSDPFGRVLLKVSGEAFCRPGSGGIDAEELALIAEEIKDAYRRFLANQVRSTFGFETVPIVVRYKNRRRRE